MVLMRNPEVKRQILVYAICSAIVVSMAFFWNVFFAVYVFCICMLGGILFFSFTEKRYDRIRELSVQLDDILYGDEKMEVVPDEEGELAVLSSKIYKMTIRLREQAEELKKEKIYLSDSLADISHQIRTPLTSIHMLVSRLQGEEMEAEDRIYLVRKVNRLLTRAEWLVTALLKLAKLESGTVEMKKELVLVSKLVKKAVEPLEVPMELKEQLLLMEVKEDAYYLGDYQWSAEALVNIVKNCMEHTPEGGTLKISAEENPIYTEILIEDNGPGLSPEDLIHLFDRFYRGENTGNEGIGIGLSLAQMIVRKQNGIIKVFNGKTWGAKFYIRFYKGAI